MIHIIKGFDVVNKPEVDVFLELSYFFYDPTDIGNLILSLQNPMNRMKTCLNRKARREFRILGDIFFWINILVWNACHTTTNPLVQPRHHFPSPADQTFPSLPSQAWLMQQQLTPSARPGSTWDAWEWWPVERHKGRPSSGLPLKPFCFALLAQNQARIH